MFTSSIKREIRHFHVVVVQLRRRNVPKNVRCTCRGFVLFFFIAFLTIFPFSLRSHSDIPRWRQVSSSEYPQKCQNQNQEVESRNKWKRGASDLKMVWKRCHFLFELFKFNFIALPGRHKQNIVFFLFSYSPSIFLFHFYVIFISCYYNMSFLSVRQYFFSRFFKKHLLISWIRH